jgi:hypothetical protein
MSMSTKYINIRAVGPHADRTVRPEDSKGRKGRADLLHNGGCCDAEQTVSDQDWNAFCDFDALLPTLLYLIVVCMYLSGPAKERHMHRDGQLDKSMVSSGVGVLPRMTAKPLLGLWRVTQGDACGCRLIEGELNNFVSAFRSRPASSRHVRHMVRG